MIDDARNSKRDIQEFLVKAAKTAEDIGKKALKYVIPDTEQPEMSVLKPFVKKRSIKRSIKSSQFPGTYQSPSHNQMYIPRSMIPNPRFINANYYNYWNGNPYWNVPRSTIPYAQPYYQQPQQHAGDSNAGTRSLNAGNSGSEAKESLQNFKSLIANVDSALVSFSDKSGVSLSENLKSPNPDAEKRAQIEKGKKRSKVTEKLAKKELKKITDTFTDFICGDSC